MKIALFTDGIFPYVIGGMQTHSYNLVKYFARNKVYVDLYHCNASEHDIAKLELFSEEEKRYIRPFVIPFPFSSNLPGHYIRDSYQYSWLIFKQFQKNKEVDFIYAKGFTAWKLLDEKRKGYACAPVGLNFHGYEMFQKPASFRSRLEQVLLLRNPVRFNIKHADYLFSYGAKITEIILSLGVPKAKLIEAPTGVERDWLVEQVRMPAGPRKFIFVGRPERRKGIEELREVLQELKGNLSFEFTFVGEIPARSRISSPNIHYAGKITDRAQMKSILQAADVLVCPSYSEGMPNVILEAMASGLAVISSHVGAASLLVSTQNGWLIEPGSISDLRSALTDAIVCPSSRIGEMKKNSLEKARKFLWEDLIVHLIDQITAKIGPRV